AALQYRSCVASVVAAGQGHARVCAVAAYQHVVGATFRGGGAAGLVVATAPRTTVVGGDGWGGVAAHVQVRVTAAAADADRQVGRAGRHAERVPALAVGSA